jgi:hypothetical protein
VILSDIDTGGRPAHLLTSGGQALSTALITGSRTIPWSEGGALEKLDVDFWIEAWQAQGGSAALSLGALRYLIRQLEELRQNPDLQPIYLQPALTAQPSPVYASRADSRDGWYYIDALQSDPESYNGRGAVEAKMTLSRVASAAASSSLVVAYTGGALASTYSATPTPLVAFPVGSTLQPATTGSRTGGEGAIPISTSPVPNPLPFVRPGTIAGLFTGGCRVWDTISTGSNPVPVAGGTYVHANWVEVKGPNHDFVGDCVVTNGLLLFLYAAGSAPCPLVYLWNTSLGTATWQSIGSVQLQDNAGNAGVLREINLDRLGLQEVRVRLRASTSAGNYVEVRQKLQAGCYHAYAELWPLTQSLTNQLALVWSSTAVYATGFTDTTSSTTFPSNLALTTTSGYAAAQGSASGAPIFGFLFQNAPTTGQGRLSTTSLFGYGDAVGPLVGSMKLYGFFAIPYSGAVVLATARGIVAPLFAQYLFDRSTSWVLG